MADPHHTPQLDAFDRFTVRLYRTGLGFTTAGVAAMGVALLQGGGPRAAVGVLGGLALSIPSLHIYDKQIRWVIATSTHAGAVLLLVGDGWVGWAGVGCTFVALSGLALKERFCFRIPGLGAVPLLLAGSLLPAATGLSAVAGLLQLAAVVPLVGLVIAKWRMPLGHDIGDKTRYQV